MRRTMPGATWLLIAGALLSARGARSESYFKDGKIHFLQSSHHDLGWHKGSYPGEMNFTLKEIDVVLDMLRKDPKFKFSGEYTIWLHEYLKRRPAERVAELKQRLKEGRLEWGAGYSQPYTSLLTGEQLARQMYLGPLWYKKNLPGKATVYFNTDIPGFGMQMPQILRKSGVDKAYLSRTDNLADINTDFVNLVGPDGSKLFCFYMHNYVDDVRFIRKGRRFVPKFLGDNAKTEEWLRTRESEHKSRRIPPEVIMFLCMDCRHPGDYTKEIASWNAYAKEKGLPPVVYSTLGEAMDAVNDGKANFKTARGEWPSKWIYEGAPSNYERVSDQRASDRLLRAAEAFSVFRALLEGGFDNYPAEALAEGWKNGVHSCHGFAPRSVLADYTKRYRAARDAGDKALGDALDAITRRVKTQSKGTPLVVYNTLSWDRTDYVSTAVPEGAPREFNVVDSKGTKIPHQMTVHETRVNTVVGSEGKGPFERDKVETKVTREDRIVFRADGVPSFGYKTYYLVNGRSSGRGRLKPGGAWKAAFENRFFTIEPGVGGLKRIFDKELRRELFRVDRFMGAEWLDYAYNGQGAGGFAFMKLPEATKDLETLRKYAPAWSCVESGPVFTAFETSVAKTRRGGIKLRVVAYESTKRIDLKCVVIGMDVEQARQLRLAFPLNAKRREVAYESPFGVVNIGEDELDNGLVEGRTSARPRETQNWIYAGDETGGVTIGSGVVAWDYDLVARERPRKGIDYPILQPVLLTSAYSCSRWLHCWTQPGDHVFDFSVYSHKPGWRNGYRRGVQTNNPLIAVAEEGKARATLPETKSFLKISPANVIVTAVKKPEEGDGVIVRFYETEGKAGSRVRIDPDAGLSGARRTNLIEEDSGPLEHDRDGASLTVGPYS
ncbi:MAG: glycoside hydrolase family 38 N-terminal domain-containing protein, partial [Planctomycetota bacterium]